MDESEIVKLCESLSLAEEDRAVHQLEEDFQQEGLNDISHCLVGKILLGKKELRGLEPNLAKRTMAFQQMLDCT
ncbi:hypothetical protein EZV62_011017 [Acer yangbiense]|uniref:Uncharacterized protein n=1 Tax=Acer yangbiense TaxID=1000413 RepID=A0A5C7I3C7_9ROSI|nr:hypothetical protein EZV62_011017 [Acer yangbiense]